MMEKNLRDENWISRNFRVEGRKFFNVINKAAKTFDVDADKINSYREFDGGYLD